MNQLVPIASPALPALVAAAGERAGIRFLEFFAANIRNPHTRRAYARAADEFLGWCASAGVPAIGAVQPVHIATWIEAGTRERAFRRLWPSPKGDRRSSRRASSRPLSFCARFPGSRRRVSSNGSGILPLRRVRRGGRSAFSGGILAAALARVRD
jgi:hypothetical protein